MWQSIYQKLRYREWSWARVVSDLFSPPVLWGVFAFPIAFRFADSAAQALLWAWTYTILVCIIPVSYIGWMVYRGRITDMHMPLRRERIVPLLVSIVATTIAWWTLRFMGAPPVMPLLALVSLAQLVVIVIITLVWQISVHAMITSSTTIATAALFGMGYALLTVPIVMLVSAARLNLKRHTPAQIVVGAAVGALVPVLVLVII